MNKISLTGRLVQDLEIKTSNNGMSYARFRVACNSKLKDKDGNKKVDFFNCFIAGKGAEILAQYTHKGDQVYLTGTMQSESRDNVVYWTLGVEDFELINTPKEKKQEAVDPALPSEDEIFGKPSKQMVEEKGIELPF